MSIIKIVTLQKIVAHDFRYVPRKIRISPHGILSIMNVVLWFRWKPEFGPKPVYAGSRVNNVFG